MDTSGNSFFYRSKLGDAFAQPENIPPEVRAHLSFERSLLHLMINRLPPEEKPDTLIVLGSMWGLLLDFALDNGLGYLGVDIVSSYVDRGNEILQKRRSEWLPDKYYGFLLSYAEYIELILQSQFNWPEKKVNALIACTYNSVGSMSNLDLLLDGIGKSGLPVHIGTYRTTKRATQARIELMRLCGYTDIVVDKRPEGVVITTGEQLSTIAYETDYFTEVAKVHNMTWYSYACGQVGKVFVNRKIFGERDNDPFLPLDL